VALLSATGLTFVINTIAMLQDESGVYFYTSSDVCFTNSNLPIGPASQSVARSAQLETLATPLPDIVWWWYIQSSLRISRKMLIVQIPGQISTVYRMHVNA
jgi:hypothetical protein